MSKKILFFALFYLVANIFSSYTFSQSCVVTPPPNATINCGQSHTLSAMTNAMSYAIVPTTCTPIDISDGTVVLPNCDDCRTNDINIGFNFNYYGNVYSTCRIQTNGIVGFGGLTYTGYNSFSIPAAGNPNNYIAGLYADLDNRCGGTIRYKLVGTAPNRKFVVSYENMKTYGEDFWDLCNGTGSATFQIILNEDGSFQVPVSKFTCDFYATTSGVLATQGAENFDGSYAEAVPGRNATDWRCISPADQDCHLFNPVPCIFQRWEVNGVTVSTDPNYTVSPTSTTTYTAVWNCGSTVCTGNVTVNVNGPTMALSTITPVTACSSPNGAVNLVLTGFTNGTYTLNYTENGTPQSTSVTVTSSPFTATISGLSVGTYSNFSISSGCNSATLNAVANVPAGIGSSAPPADGVSICAGSSGSLTASGCAPINETISVSGSGGTSNADSYGGAGNTDINIVIPALPVGAVVTGVTGRITYTSHSPSYRSELRVRVTPPNAGNVMNNIQPSTAGSSGDVNDAACGSWTAVQCPNPVGNWTIQFRESYNDGTPNPDASITNFTITVSYTINNEIQWYTTSVGGAPIGTGSPFNPVGVAGSGIANTDSPGSYSFFAACSSDPGCRSEAIFEITSLQAQGTQICVQGTGELSSPEICPDIPFIYETQSESGSGGTSNAESYGGSGNTDISINFPALPAGATITGITGTITYTSNSPSYRSELRVRVTPPNAGTQINDIQPSTLTSSGTVTGATCGTWTPAQCPNPVGTWTIRFRESTNDWWVTDANISNFTIYVNYTLPGPAGELQWYTTAVGGAPIGTGSPFNPVGVAGSGLANTNTPGTYTYYVACSSKPECRTATNFVITPGSVAPTLLNGGGNICQGNTATLSIDGGNLVSGAEWEWFEGSCGGVPVDVGSQIYVTPNTTTTYYVRASAAAGCPPSDCVSGTVTLPPMGNQLSLDGESATCVVNDNNFIHFYHSSGRLLASINSNGQNLGDVSITSYVDAGAVMVPDCDDPSNTALHTSVMRRHWVITPEFQPLSPVLVRLPFSDTELNTLVIESNANSNTNDNVAGLPSIMLTKYHGPLNVDNNPLNNCPADGGNGNHEIFGQTINGSTIDYSLVTNANYVDYTIPNFSEFWLHGSTDPSALPVNLISFSGECIDDKIKFNWSTASELNSDKYTLQNSRDNFEWFDVTTIQSFGNSNTIQNYSTEVTKNQVSGEYFRLKQIDIDGTVEYLSTISVNCNDNSDLIELYPNPNNGVFTLKISSSFSIKNTSICVVDISGKMVYSELVDFVNGVNNFNIDLSTINSGSYLIYLPDHSDKYSPIKFIIK